MTTAREIMTPSATFLEPTHTVADAAAQMAADDIGALPVCESGRLVGMLTDRDLVLRVINEGRDPASTRVSDVLQKAEVVTIGADDTVEEAITTMKDHAVRRLPVIDGHDMVGIVSQADIAMAMSKTKVGDLVGAISSAPPNG